MNRKGGPAKPWNYLHSKPQPIEPNILPLVQALNGTKLVQTFSSCQGHFTAKEQIQQDRTFADVRFRKLPGTTESQLDNFIGFIVSFAFSMDVPVTIDVYQKYTIWGEPRIYFLKIAPHSRLGSARTRRQQTDLGIALATSLVKKAMIPEEVEQFRKMRPREIWDEEFKSMVIIVPPIPIAMLPEITSGLTKPRKSKPK